MRRGMLAGGGALTLALVAAVACGPRETPEQKLQRLRNAHQIIPVGATTLHDAEGAPSVIVDVSVTNQGVDPLPQLTVMVRVRGQDGVEKAALRASLDLEGVRPGVGVQRDVRVPGVELGEHDEVTVELESGLPVEVLREFPEYSVVAGSTG